MSVAATVILQIYLQTKPKKRLSYQHVDRACIITQLVICYFSPVLLVNLQPTDLWCAKPQWIKRLWALIICFGLRRL